MNDYSAEDKRRGLHIAIIGGGIGGLAAARRLLRAGASVTVLEGAPILGGLAGTFEIAGTRLERHYHHVFLSDTDFIQLTHELGLDRELLWLESRMGFYTPGHVYPFGTPLELLRFGALSPIDRIRCGLILWHLQKRTEWHSLERVTAAEWLRPRAGKAVFRVVWEPLLKSKFGEDWDRVSMAWLWARIFVRAQSRRGLFARERLGYMRGSFHILLERLAQEVVRLGGQVLTSAPVRRVLTDGRGRLAGLETPRGTIACDAAIATLQSPAFARLIEGVPGIPTSYVQMLRDWEYQGNICMVLQLRESLSRIYWLNIADPSVPFTALVEHTNLAPRAWYEGKHIFYLGKYLRTTHPHWSLDDDDLVREWLPHVRRIFPQFSEDLIEQRWVFRAPYAQPVVTVGYGERIPDLRTPLVGLYLANMTQIYPEDRGMNYSIRLGHRVADTVLQDAPMLMQAAAEPAHTPEAV